MIKLVIFESRKIDIIHQTNSQDAGEEAEKVSHQVVYKRSVPTISTKLRSARPRHAFYDAPSAQLDDAGCGPTGTDVCCKTGTGINNSGLWILTRQTNPSDDLVDKVREIAHQKGFATSVLFDVVHDENCNVPDINEETNFLRLRK